MSARSLHQMFSRLGAMGRVWIYPRTMTIVVLTHPQDLVLLEHTLENARTPGVKIEIWPLRFWDYWFLTKQKVIIKEVL